MTRLAERIDYVDTKLDAVVARLARLERFLDRDELDARINARADIVTQRAASLLAEVRSTLDAVHRAADAEAAKKNKTLALKRAQDVVAGSAHYSAARAAMAALQRMVGSPEHPPKRRKRKTR